MDTLAYNHLVSSYESPRTANVDGSLVLFRSVNWSQLSGACWMPAIATAIGLSMLGVSKPAQATVYYGDRGYEVKQVQYALQDYGYFNGNATGYFGSKTKHAVKAFQEAYGLYPDGIVGPATAAAMGLGSYSKPSYTHTSYNPCGHCDGGSNYLSKGDRGYDVKQLQKRLAAHGYFHANYTGYYGTLTKHAVKAFQEDCGLSADGIAGPATLAALGL